MATADYRSLQDSVNTENLSKKSTQLSYANVTKSTPCKEQAIVIDAHDGIPLKDYIITVGKLTDPLNIRYVSRISNSRICIFMSTQNVVNELCLNHPTVNINNISLNLRPLVIQNKRIILSNVCPILPNSVIE